MMNFLSAYNVEGAEKGCYYCRRVFKSRRMLEIHLRAHQDVAKLQKYNQSGSDSSKISINSTSSNLSLFLKGPSGNSFRPLGTNPLVSTAAKNLDTMPPNFSSASNSIASSKPLVPIGYHMNPDSLFKDSNLQHGLDIKKFLSMKEPTTVGIMPRCQTQPFGFLSPHDNCIGLTSESVKKHRLNEVQEHDTMISAVKKPKIQSIPSICSERSKPQKKELLLLKDVMPQNKELVFLKDAKSSFSTSEIIKDAQGKCEYLDLSLHL